MKSARGERLAKKLQSKMAQKYAKEAAQNQQAKPTSLPNLP